MIAKEDGRACGEAPSVAFRTRPVARRRPRMEVFRLRAPRPRDRPREVGRRGNEKIIRGLRGPGLTRVAAGFSRFPEASFQGRWGRLNVRKR